MDRPSVRPPKVLRVIARLNIGGPARHAVILSEGLSPRFDTLLVHGSLTQDEGSFEDLLRVEGVQSVRLAGLGRRVRPWSDLLALRDLIRLVFREKPDIVHTHTSKAGALGRLAGLAFNLTRAKADRAIVVHTFHGHVLHGYFGPAGNLVVRSVERALARWTDRIVTISRGQRDEIARLLRLEDAKVCVIPLGLELGELLSVDRPDRALRAEAGWTADEWVLGYVGRFVAIKDLSTLLLGFAAFASGYPKARLLLVGDGGLRAPLDRLASDLGIAPLVHFAGWQQDLKRIYGAMDALALTSRNEGTPVAVIEALAAGLPVVATSVGGVPDVVKDRETGLLIAPGDPAALAATLREIAGDPQLARRLGSAGREDVASRFSRERLVADVDALYVDLLRRRPARPSR